MERDLVLKIAIEDIRLDICKHISLFGFEMSEIYATGSTYETWALACHECGDIFRITYEVD
jgi:hypothetical protein